MDNKFSVTNKYALYIIPLSGIIGLIIPLITGHINLFTLGVYLSVPMILAPILFIKFNSQVQGEMNLCIIKNFKVSSILYIILFNISIIILYTSEIRPISYYLTIATITTLILIQIFNFEISKNKERIILVEIMILMLNIIWGVTLKYYYFISRTDPLGHVRALKSLISSNFVVNEAFGKYIQFPLWHILCASLYKVTGISIPIQKIMFITNGMIYAFLILIIYLITVKFFKDKKIGMISALITSINPIIITYGMSSIPRSVVSFLEAILILSMCENTIRAKEKKIILVITTISIIIYHTVSMPFIMSILLIIYILIHVYTNNDKLFVLNRNYLILSLVLSIAYWIFYANSLFEILVSNIISSAPTGILTTAIVDTPLTELFNYLQYFPLLLFILLGFFWALECKECSPIVKIFCIVGLFSVAVSFPGPALLINKLAGNFDFQRFDEYTFIFISLVASFGLFKIYSNSTKTIKLLVIVLFFCMSFLSVSNDFTASDNPLVKRPFYTYYLSEEEVTSFDHLASITNGLLMSDYITIRYLLFSKFEFKAHMLEVDENHMDFLKNETDDVILIRNGELKKRPLKLYSAKKGVFELSPSWSNGLKYYYNDIKIWDALNHYNKIYDSNNIYGFT